MSYRNWIRENPRLGALVGLLACLFLVAVNTGFLLLAERWFPIIFPLVGAALPILFMRLLVGGHVHPETGRPPVALSIFAVLLAIVGLAGGVYANYWLTGEWF